MGIGHGWMPTTPGNIHTIQWRLDLLLLQAVSGEAWLIALLIEATFEAMGQQRQPYDTSNVSRGSSVSRTGLSSMQIAYFPLCSSLAFVFLLTLSLGVCKSWWKLWVRDIYWPGIWVFATLLPLARLGPNFIFIFFLVWLFHLSRPAFDLFLNFFSFAHKMPFLYRAPLIQNVAMKS